MHQETRCPWEGAGRRREPRASRHPRRPPRGRPSGILRSMADGFRSPLAVDANAGTVAIVTGGGTGIGRATALELARTGADVAICGRRAGADRRGPRDARVRREEVLAASCDVREPDDVSTFLDDVRARFGRVDVLVNNAGGQFAAPAEDISLKGLRAVHRLNVDAVWDVTREVARRWMIPQPPRGDLLPRLQPAPWHPDDGALVHGPLGARDDGRVAVERVVALRHPRRVHRRGVDRNGGAPAVRRAGGPGGVRGTGPDAARRSRPRRSRLRSRSSPRPAVAT